MKPHTTRHPNPATAEQILAFDPGGTLGWSLLTLIDNTDSMWEDKDLMQLIDGSSVRWEHGEIDTALNEFDAMDQVCKMIDEQPNAAIIIEDFILSPKRNETSRELLSPVRQTAILKWHCRQRNRAVIMQSPSNAKRMTNDRLKLWGWYQSTGSLEHARDADRHIVYFVRNCLGTQGKALRERAWGTWA